MYVDVTVPTAYGDVKPINLSFSDLCGAYATSFRVRTIPSIPLSQSPQVDRSLRCERSNATFNNMNHSSVLTAGDESIFRVDSYRLRPSVCLEFTGYLPGQDIEVRAASGSQTTAQFPRRVYHPCSARALPAANRYASDGGDLVWS